MAGRDSARGDLPAAGTIGGSFPDGGSLGVDGRRNGIARGSASASTTRPSIGGYGDGNIFSASNGLHEVAKSRTGSSYAGSAHGGSQSDRGVETRVRDVSSRQPRVAYNGDAPRRAESMASDEHEEKDVDEFRRNAPDERLRSHGSVDERLRIRDERRDEGEDWKNEWSTRGNASNRANRRVSADASMRGAAMKKETDLNEIHFKSVDDASSAKETRTQSSQTDVAGLDAKNVSSQLKFQASLQSELGDAQEALVEARLRVRELLGDKKRLEESLENALADEKPRSTSSIGTGQRKDDSEDGVGVGDDAATPTREEMDETVHSLLEMITAERDKAAALESHLERATSELDAERNARVRSQTKFAERARATEEEFSAQERKLREATEIISELRRALLSVMRLRENSAADGSQRGSGSDGGRSGSSRRSGGLPPTASNAPRRREGDGDGDGEGDSRRSFGTRERNSNPPRGTVALFSGRPVSSAARALAREASRRRSEEAARRWERRLEESVDDVLARSAAGSAEANPEAFLESTRLVLREAVDAHVAFLVDELRDARWREDDRDAEEDRDAEDVESACGVDRREPSLDWNPPRVDVDVDVERKSERRLDGGARFAAWLAEEDKRRTRLRERVRSLREALRRCEASRRDPWNDLLRFREAREPGRRSIPGDDARIGNAAVSHSRFSAIRRWLTLNVDLDALVRGARARASRYANTPGFEVTWPLLLVALVVRAQLG